MRAIFSLALLATATFAHALGLGDPIGTPVLGKPLRLDIPLTGQTGAVPGSECLHLTPPAALTDELYFPRSARAAIEMRQGKPVVVVVAPAISQPVIEFRLAIKCGFGFARDFTLLASLPSADSPLAEAPAVQPLTSPASAAPQPSSAIGSGQVLRLSQATTLEALAREKYPTQPKAREKFKRMLQAANGGLIATGAHFDAQRLPGGTELVIPKGLPARRKTATPLPLPQTAMAPKPPRAKGQTRQDRLTVGAAPALTDTETVIALDRLETINTAQARAQEELTARIARAQESFALVQKYVLETEARIRALEEKQARRAETTQAWQLASAVLLGGLLGAGVLRGYLYWAMRRKASRAKRHEVAATAPAAAASPLIPSVFSALHQSPQTAPPATSTATPAPRKHDFDFMSWIEDEKEAPAPQASAPALR